MRECDRCGGLVTSTFFRCASVDGVLHSCPECTPNGEILRPSDDGSDSLRYQRLFGEDDDE